MTLNVDYCYSALEMDKRANDKRSELTKGRIDKRIKYVSRTVCWSVQYLSSGKKKSHVTKNKLTPERNNPTNIGSCI